MRGERWHAGAKSTKHCEDLLDATVHFNPFFPTLVIRKTLPNNSLILVSLLSLLSPLSPLNLVSLYLLKLSSPIFSKLYSNTGRENSPVRSTTAAESPDAEFCNSTTIELSAGPLFAATPPTFAAEPLFLLPSPSLPPPSPSLPLLSPFLPL